jgi:membrane protein
MLQTLTATFKKFQADEMTDRAAALTYYVMMSLFPALLVGVSLLGLIGDRTTVSNAVDYATRHGAPHEVTNALDALLTKTVDSAGGAVSFALLFGIIVALYGASGAFGAAGRALNDVYGVTDTRSYVSHKAKDIGFTTLVIALALVALVSVFLGGGIAHDLFGTIGLGDTAASIWGVGRWVVAIGAVLGIYAIVFRFAPDEDARRPGVVSHGALVGVGIWIVASAGFFFYVSNFGKYAATYGTFAGAVILLLWLYLSSIAFLFGAELNSVVDGDGQPPPAELDTDADGYGADALAERPAANHEEQPEPVAAAPVPASAPPLAAAPAGTRVAEPESEPEPVSYPPWS